MRLFVEALNGSRRSIKISELQIRKLARIIIRTVLVMYNILVHLPSKVEQKYNPSSFLTRGLKVYSVHCKGFK